MFLIYVYNLLCFSFLRTVHYVRLVEWLDSIEWQKLRCMTMQLAKCYVEPPYLIAYVAPMMP